MYTLFIEIIHDVRSFRTEIIGGGFTYSDQYENELASVRWFKTGMDGQIRWKYNSLASPPDSWWMSSVVPRGNITWGFKNQITDGSWVFRVGKCGGESSVLADAVENLCLYVYTRVTF